MSNVPTSVKLLARRMVTGGGAGTGVSDGDVLKAIRACEKLGAPLIKLAGPVGYSSLMSRALAVAKRGAPGLAGVRMTADGALLIEAAAAGGLEATKTNGRGESDGVALVSELLVLLVTLIGEPLTLTIVREAWPEVSMESLQ